MPTLYGPQNYTAGDFGSRSPYESVNTGTGADEPIAEYPDVVAFENIHRSEGGGPAGHAIDAFDDTDYSTSGLVLYPGVFGSLSNYQLNLTTGEVVIEWWQYLKASSFAEDPFGNALALAHAGFFGTGPGLDGNDLFLHLETIEGDEQLPPQFQWWLRVEKWDTGFDYDLPPVDDVADDAWHRMQVILKAGTVVGDLTDVLHDGFVKVYKDATPGVPHSGTLLFSDTDIDLIFNIDGDGTTATYMLALWHGYFDMVGPHTGTWIYTGTPTIPIIDGGVPCCGTAPVPGGGSPGDILPPDHSVPFTWEPQCEGGGQAPDVADISFSEDWRP